MKREQIAPRSLEGVPATFANAADEVALGETHYCGDAPKQRQPVNTANRPGTLLQRERAARRSSALKFSSQSFETE